ncbi:MAG: PAS domain S-box protein [Leptospiraceae bacterium]|nr:PAS domain S-box protein [Leptospiraceae bacterium]
MIKNKYTILLVEDDELLAIVNKESLESCDYTVLTAKTANESISLIRTNNSIDLILMDIDLGGDIDGIDLARSILTEKDFPIIFLSSLIEQEILQKAELVSSFGYIPKKSEIQVLCTSIKMALNLFEAKNKMKQSELHYRLLFEQSHDAMIITDSNGKFTDANDAASQLFRYSRDELLTLSISDIIHPEDLANKELQLEKIKSNVRLTSIRRVLRKDKSIALTEITVVYRPDQFFQATIRDITEQNLKDQVIEAKNKNIEKAHNDLLQRQFAKDGSYYWVATTIAPLKNKDGKVEEYFAIRTDITIRKNAEEELVSHQIELEAQYQELYDTQDELVKTKMRYFDLYDLAPVGYFTLDENGIILEVNSTLATLLEWDDTHSFREEPIERFICPQDQDNFDFFEQELVRTKKARSCEIRMKRKDNSEFWVRLDSLPFSLENGMQVTRTAVTNIHKRKEVEKELHHYMKALEQINNTKNKFFNIIAHDLRNPFGGIIGISDLLETKLKEMELENSNLLFKYTELIQTSSKSAYSLLENLLLWARAQTGELSVRLNNISLNHLILFMIPLVSSIAFKKNISIETELLDADTVYADEFFLNTILRNLLTNAIKFTYPNGKVIISTEKREGYLEVSVTDTGTGIDEKRLENLFRIDSKVSKNGTDNERGSGLGLILCKEFVEKQGGKIWVTSELGKGSRFTFSILICPPNSF